MKKSAIFFCLMFSMNLMASQANKVYPIDLKNIQWDKGINGYFMMSADYSSHAVDYCFWGNGKDITSAMWIEAQSKVKSTIEYLIPEVSGAGYNKGYLDACDKGLNSDQSLLQIIRKRAADSPLQYGTAGLVVAGLSVYVGCKLYSDIRARFSQQNKKS